MFRQFVITGFVVLSCVLPGAAHAAAKAEVLSKTTKSWDGAALAYPAGEAEISIVRVTIAPGDKLDFHCHPVPSAAYVVTGDLEVTVKDGTKREFHTGETITEVVNRLHRGTNLSADKPVELIVFYAGAAGVPLTIHDTAPGKRCRE